jgi:hypothetical protein
MNNLKKQTEETPEEIRKGLDEFLERFVQKIEEEVNA